MNLLSPFLKTGTILPLFHSKGNVLVLKHSSKILHNGLQIDLPQMFIIQIIKLSWPWALFGSSFWITFMVSSSEKSNDRCLSVKYWTFTRSVHAIAIYQSALICKVRVEKFCFLFKISSYKCIIVYNWWEDLDFFNYLGNFLK